MNISWYGMTYIEAKHPIVLDKQETAIVSTINKINFTMLCTVCPKISAIIPGTTETFILAYKPKPNRIVAYIIYD